ncbi:MAG: DUF2799 domain-containing protein [Desulfamplus sp.]|nr:DUF2799 domain-containing protein [Desulfamplus sp.]
MQKTSVIFILVGLLFAYSSLSGCATMNQSECQNADWELIGFKDGSKGRLNSYLENHRNACAKYNITPNLQAYLRGHKNGVKEFCTEYNGFEEGKRGWSYNGVCPSELSGDFLKGYYVGQKFHAVLSAIERSESSIRFHQMRINSLVDEVRELEHQLAHKDTSKDERRSFLRRIRHNQREIRKIEHEIFEYEMDIDRREFEYNQLKMEYKY